MAMKRFELWLPEKLMAQVDAWRDMQGVPAPRAAAIRRLIEIGLAAAAKPEPKKASK